MKWLSSIILSVMFSSSVVADHNHYYDHHRYNHHDHDNHRYNHYHDNGWYHRYNDITRYDLYVQRNYQNWQYNPYRSYNYITPNPSLNFSFGINGITLGN